MRIFPRIFRLLFSLALVVSALVAVSAATADSASAVVASPSCTTAASGVGCSQSQAAHKEMCSGDANWGLQIYIPPSSLLGFVAPIINNIVNPILNMINPLACALTGFLAGLVMTTGMKPDQAGEIAGTPTKNVGTKGGWFDPATANTSGTFPNCVNTGGYDYSQSNCFATTPATNSANTNGFASGDGTSFDSSAQGDNIKTGVGIPGVVNAVDIVSVPTGTTVAPISGAYCPASQPYYKAMLANDPNKLNLLANPLLPNGLISVQTLGIAGNAPAAGKRVASATLNLLGGIPLIPGGDGKTYSSPVLGAVLVGMSTDGSKVLTKIGLNLGNFTSMDPSGSANSAISTFAKGLNVGFGVAISVGPGGRATATNAESWGTMVGVGPYLDLQLPMGLGYLGTGGLGTPAPFDRTISNDVKYSYSSCHASVASPASRTNTILTGTNSSGTNVDGATFNAAQTVNFKATVTSANGVLAVGTVQFSDNGSPIGAPVLLDLGGSATLANQVMGAGSHSVQGVFAPTVTGAILPSTSNAVAMTVVGAASPGATPPPAHGGPPVLK